MAAPLRVFHYQSYKTYLKEGLNAKGRGSKTELARWLGCQPPFLTQVLGGKLHLSPEQALRAAEFFGLAGKELRYFLALNHHGRAATPALRALHAQEIEALRMDSQVFFSPAVDYTTVGGSAPQFGPDYYLTWYFSVVHLLTESPRYRTARDLARALGLDAAQVQNALDYLVRHKFVARSANGAYSRTEGGHLLMANLPGLRKAARIAWMNRTGVRIQDDQPFETLFDTVTVCSRADAARLNRELAAVLAAHSKRLDKSEPEAAYYLGLQFYSLMKN